MGKSLTTHLELREGGGPLGLPLAPLRVCQAFVSRLRLSYRRRGCQRRGDRRWGWRWMGRRRCGEGRGRRGWQDRRLWRGRRGLPATPTRFGGQSTGESGRKLFLLRGHIVQLVSRAHHIRHSLSGYSGYSGVVRVIGDGKLDGTVVLLVGWRLFKSSYLVLLVLSA